MRQRTTSITAIFAAALAALILLAHGTAAAQPAATPAPPMQAEIRFPAEVADITAKTSNTLPKDTQTTHLRGRDMSGEGYQPPHIEGQMQLLQHYGSITGMISIEKPMTTVSVELKPRPMNGSNPVVNLFAERVAGDKYLRVQIMKDVEIKSEGVFRVGATVPPGTYKVTLGFYKSSKPDRSHLEVHDIQFLDAKGGKK
ncbi:MAG: hypothetical protein K1X53_17945 [Candidatus Sumerlaeaceae bacterium]|nr:hypothetical protein [Candidatus Sumerlaeaceae bacterium]